MKSAAATNAKLSASLELFSMDGEHVETTRYISVDKVTLRIRAGNAAKYADLLKTAHRTFPRGAYKRAGGGRDYPHFEAGMTTKEYVIRFMNLNTSAHILPLDFDALGDRPAALYENGALDFDVIEEPIDTPEIEETVSLGDRFEAELAKRKAAREALAAQDVAQVVAQAVAAAAISEAMQASEAMQPSEAGELVTCEAGDNEAQGARMGSASTGPAWTPAPQYTPPSPVDTGFGQSTPPAFRGNDNGDKEAPSAPSVAEFFELAPAYTLPENKVGNDWNGYESGQFTPDARQQVIIDAVTVALNEKLFYTVDVLARCIDLLKIDAHTASMNFERRVEGGIVGMDVYYARHHIEAKQRRAASKIIFDEMALRVGDELGILVFTDYKRTTGVKITGDNGTGFQFTGKRGAYTVSGTGSADQFKCAIERAFTKGSRKTDYPAFLESQAKRPAPTPTPPAMESQPVAAAPVVETEPTTYAERKAQIDADYSHIPEGNRPPAFIYGEGLEAWEMDASTFSKQSRNNPHWTQSYPCGDGDYLRDCFATHAAIVAAHEAQDVPAVNPPEVPAAQPIKSGAWTPERCEYELSAQQASCKPTINSKSGKWCAWLYLTGNSQFGLRFESATSGNVTSTHRTAKERMSYLSSIAKAADAPTDTPPTGGLPCPVSPATPESAPDTPSMESGPSTPSTVSSEPRYPRNVVPGNGLHIVDDAFEAWTYHHDKTGRFAFVIYLGKSAKPWKHHGFKTEKLRDIWFSNYSAEAREISEAKSKRKADDKVKLDQGHGLQVGDVVRSSWGYDQTNINHYQITAVIGKRTVEVRELAEHEESTGDMSGRVAPVHGDFVGEAKRCTVDKWGQVNVRGKDYGRASKIEPVAVVHGVRCYAASHCSTYA